jgi:hypothetical protein
MCFPSRPVAKLTGPRALVALAAVLVCVACCQAQAIDAKIGSGSCASPIPTGVKVVKVPDEDQHKVTLSGFSVSTNKDAGSYDLQMQIKNGTDKWCITSFGLTYVLGDARGQEWTASEYPAVMTFKVPSIPARPVSGRKPLPTIDPSPHNLGMAPGEDATRIVVDIYNYIQPHPSGYFDGFHLISAEMKYCMGYILNEAK